MLQGQKEGWNYRGVAKNILSEKLVFESEGCEGASLADSWGRAFKAALNTKVLWQITAGMLGEQQGSQCSWSQTFTGTDARNKIPEEQGLRCMLPKHIPLYQSQRKVTHLPNFHILKMLQWLFFKKIHISIFSREQQQQQQQKANIFAWGKIPSFH